MKVQIDSELCQGHGQCVIQCPELFHSDEQGFAVVDSPDIPREHEAAVAKAEAGCPECAILTTPA